MQNLMIIESPNKIKTISKYLKHRNFYVVSTLGHFRNLVKFEDKKLEFHWEYEPSKLANWKKIKKLANESKQIYVATDPDREGEGIAWHIYECLSKQNLKKVKRVVFNEISETAILNALDNPRQLDQNQVNSYLARIGLDIKIGFDLSKYAQKKYQAKSAGRVQSVALKIVVENEQEINNFKPQEYYSANLELVDAPIKCDLIEIDKKWRINHQDFLATNIVNFTNKQLFDTFIEHLANLKPNNLALVKDLSLEEESFDVKRKSFKTSTLQVYANKKFKLSIKEIEKICQKLYQGVLINGEQKALITYPRTDREDLSEGFVAKALTYIKNKWGEQYCAKDIKPIKQNALSQGAHEGIRPVDLELEPILIKPYLEESHYQVYVSIYYQALSSLFSLPVFKHKKLKLWFGDCLWGFSVKKMMFDGYYKIVSRNLDETKIKQQIDFLDNLKLKQQVEFKLITTAKFTTPPERLNQSKLVQILEKEGIGRPSTFASTVEKILSRDYVEEKNKKFYVSYLGKVVANGLNNDFADFINYGYTKQMENCLDLISKNRLSWESYLNETFDVFDKQYKQVLNS